MLDIEILLFRYLFIFCILYFIYQGIKVNLYEYEIINSDPYKALTKQRITIIIFHLSAFLVLITADAENFSTNLFIGALSLFLIIIANILMTFVYKKGSPIINNSILFIIDIGIVTLQRLNPELLQKQLLWIFIGVAVMLILPFVLYLIKTPESLKYLYLFVGFALLISTLFFGSEEGGAKNWIKIYNFNFQPSEVVKILFIFYVASVFSQRPHSFRLIPPIIMCAILVMCLVIQKDLGSALIFFMTFLVMLYISTGNIFLFFGGLGSMCVASVFAYYLFSHIRTRIEIWIDPWSDISNKGYQIAQSLFAIGTWGLTGCGLTRGYAHLIPVVERDFIFSAICEEFGIIFAIGVIAVYFLIFIECIKTARQCTSRFYCLVTSGLVCLMCFQTFLIIGGVTKLIPLTGVTLPFISYGGSSAIVCFFIMGIIQWISCNKVFTEDSTKED